MEITEENLIKKIKILNTTIWEDRASWPSIDNWLDNFQADERLNSLFLLSNFMYFGHPQMMELMNALYRDLYKYPIIKEIREGNSDTTNINLINTEFLNVLKKTRFIGVGNPSESGCHLLYFLRQQNHLPKNIFAHTHEIFQRRSGVSSNPTMFRDATVSRYIFIDDFCGSGQQGAEYLKEIVSDIKNIDPNVFVAYYVLFATTAGLERIRAETGFDSVECVLELDTSFKLFDDNSRYFTGGQGDIDKDDMEQMCSKYGSRLLPAHPLGYNDCQLLIGFHHNIPDNTIPIIWYFDPFNGGVPWRPIFKRFSKVYSW